MQTSARNLFCVFLLAVPCASGFGQSSGSIYTTDARGEQVNLNVFSAKNRVYLGGGPAVNNCTSSGLADGMYYFQVTSPSGGTLLTVDSIENRRISVVDGVFDAYIGSRRTANGPCGSIIVRLDPYLDTPNSSGEYKVWLTRVEHYNPAQAGVFGFQSRDSKTDNFKVRGSGRPLEQSVIRGAKFYDYNCNGIWDPAVPEEVSVPGWRFELWRNGVQNGVIFTDQDGAFEFIRDLDGSTYEVREVPPPPGFIPAIGARWHPTTQIVRAAIANTAIVDVGKFGNVSFTEEPVSGLATSKGYWHFQGASVLNTCDPDWRAAVNGPPEFPLCLRRNISTPDPAISIFTIGYGLGFESAFEQLSSYLISPAYGHAGYILSVQVCASVLNRACGPFSEFGLVAIDVAGDDRLRTLDDLIDGVRVLLCDPRAGETGPGQNEDLRAMMMGCINEFEQANTESGSTHVPKRTAVDFTSPYGTL